MKNELSICLIWVLILAGVPGLAADEQKAAAPTPQTEEQVTEQKRLATERALDERRARQEEIAVRYSTSPDGKLTPEDRRRHAHDLFVQKNDLNGDGKVDQHELRVMVEASKQRKQKQAEQKSTETAAELAKKGEQTK